MRRLLPCLVAALALAIPALADVHPINPFDPNDPNIPAEIKLPPDEAARLQALQGAVYTYFQGDLSPNDRHVMVYDALRGLSFLDVRSGTRSPVSPDLFAIQWLTERRWRDANTLVLIGAPYATGELNLVRVDVATGAVATEPIALPGFPLSLSSSARKVLLVRVPVARGAAPGARTLAPNAAQSPIRTIPLAPRFLKAATAPIFEAEEKLTARLTTADLELVVYDLVTKKERVLFGIEQGTAIASVAWAPSEEQLALVRWKYPDNTRGGGIPDDDPGVLDTLGRLAPWENPFYTSNTLDIVRLSGRRPTHIKIRPSLRAHEVFVWAVWGPDGRTLATQVWHAAQLEERDHPTFANPDRSSYRFYTAEGHAFGTLRRHEVGSIYSIGPFFASPHELLLAAPWRMGWTPYVYDLRTGDLRRLPVAEGAMYQGLATRGSKELVFNFGSFLEPPEVYRIGLRSVGPIAVTSENAGVKALHQIRVDRVQFTLPGGHVREGRLIQPRTAAFPPANVPIVVWQQGGPTGYMGNEWGGSVEQPFSILPNFGFAMLVVPLEGRVNFGPDRLNALADGRNFGQVDVDEGANIAQQVIDRGWTRQDQLGIVGCSYGGYFTSQSITEHPDLYAAANTQCTLLDLFDEYENGYKSYISYLMGRTPMEDPVEVERDSPVRNAAKVMTPTLIFDGTYDFLPYTFSEQFHDDINAAGTKADFYLFDYEGHGLGLPGSQFVAGEAQLFWFRTYLKMH